VAPAPEEITEKVGINRQVAEPLDALAHRSSGLRDRRRGQQANDPFTIDDDG
jgi:hypothetical protein